MMHEERCNMCDHWMENNSHGFDQNDGHVEYNSDREPRLIHSGTCTYCKECNPYLKGGVV